MICHVYELTMNAPCPLRVKELSELLLCIASAAGYTQTGQSQSSKRSFIIMNKHAALIRKATSVATAIQLCLNSQRLPAAIAVDKSLGHYAGCASPIERS